jgi:hypothetical protein
MLIKCDNCHLLDLPAELRNRIWEFAVVGNGMSKHPDHFRQFYTPVVPPEEKLDPFTLRRAVFSYA